METALFIFGVVLLFTFCLLALASLVVGLPGTFLILGAALLYAWLTGFSVIEWATLGWLLLLALIAEGIELLSGTVGAARERPSRRVTVAVLLGGFAGGLIGTPFFLGVGSLIGALLGAFAGAALAVKSEGGSMGSAMSTGLAALRGRLLGFIVKASIAVVMIVVLFAAVL